ncbi:MAG TPA: sporulation regulator WhiA, partial [Clostridiales bacterium]|nr:sporulation regulator WhiA [Clostridiales bacterium]
LQEVAFLRLANPEESLDSLVKLSGGKISKSGLYHRLKKLEKIANELK